jgi:hypothetical protein
MLTTENVEDLLITHVGAIVDPGNAVLFNKVGSLFRDEFVGDQVAPSAWVGLESDTNTGTRSRLVMRETYAVLVYGETGTTNIPRQIHPLCEAVINAVHGKDWMADDDISPFMYEGRTMISHTTTRVGYKLRFTITHKGFIPVHF